MRKKIGMTKPTKEIETIKFFEGEEQSTEKKMKKQETIKLATYLSYDDMIRLNNILAEKSRNKIKMLKPAEVLRQLLLQYINDNTQ
jgi:hypothetical protein